MQDASPSYCRALGLQWASLTQATVLISELSTCWDRQSSFRGCGEGSMLMYFNDASIKIVSVYRENVGIFNVKFDIVRIVAIWFDSKCLPWLCPSSWLKMGCQPLPRNTTQLNSCRSTNIARLAGDNTATPLRAESMSSFSCHLDDSGMTPLQTG